MTNDKLDEAIKIINTCIQDAATSNSAFTKLKELNASITNRVNECKDTIGEYMDAISEAADYQQFEAHHWEEPNDAPDSIPCNQLNGEW